MTGTLLERAGGCPIPVRGHPSRQFTRWDVVAVGRLRRYGDKRQHYMVRLAGGEELLVTLSGESQIDRRWLQAHGAEPARRLPWNVRDAGFAEAWQKVEAP